MFEHKSEPLLSSHKFFYRLAKQAFGCSLILIAWMLIGICGYHFFEDLSWIDSLLNASMIASGMGPVDILHSTAAKLFASFYAIFSGVIFIAIMGILLTPVAHRILHKFHVRLD